MQTHDPKQMVKPQVTNRFLLPKTHNISKPNSPRPQLLTKGRRNTSGTFPFHRPSALPPQGHEHKANPKRLSAFIPKLGFSSQSHSAPAPVCICPLESQAEKARPERGAGLPNQSMTSLHPFPPTSPWGRDGNPKKALVGSEGEHTKQEKLVAS